MLGYYLAGGFLLWCAAGCVLAMVLHITGILKDR